MAKGFVCAWAAALLLANAAPSSAVSIGMADTFETGASGWDSGLSSVIRPAVVANGGPGGAGDGYLLLTALGGIGPNSRLTGIAGPQWAGDYFAAAVNGITMDVKNLGDTTLDLRLRLVGPLGDSALTSEAVRLAAHGDWTSIRFSLEPAALLGAAAGILGNVQELRLFHATAATLPGEPIVAMLGIDNVTAVPEPAAVWMMLSGLAAVGAIVRRRQRPV